MAEDSHTPQDAQGYANRSCENAQSSQEGKPDGLEEPTAEMRQMMSMPEKVDVDECIDIEDLDGDHHSVSSKAGSEDDEDTYRQQYGLDEEMADAEADGAGELPMTPDHDNIPDMSKCSVFNAHEEAALSIAICPTDPSIVISGGQDNEAYIWKIPQISTDQSDKGAKPLTKVKKLTPSHGDSVVQIAWSHDGKYFATASYDALVRVWTPTGELVAELVGPGEEIEVICWHPRGHAILAGSTDNTCWMWWAPTGKTMNVFASHGSAVTCATFAKQGQLVVTASLDNSVIVNHPKDGTALITYRNLSEGGVISLAGHPTLPIVAAGCDDGTIHILHLEQQKVLAKLNGHTDTVEALCWYVDSSIALLISGSLDGQIAIWNGQTYECRIKKEEHMADGGIVKLLMHPNGLPYCITSSTDNTMRVYEVRTGDCLQTLTGHSDGVLDISAVKTGAGPNFRVASASDDSSVKVWEIGAI